MTDTPPVIDVEWLRSIIDQQVNFKGAKRQVVLSDAELDSLASDIRFQAGHESAPQEREELDEFPGYHFDQDTVWAAQVLQDRLRRRLELQTDSLSQKENVILDLVTEYLSCLEKQQEQMSFKASLSKSG